MVKTIVSFESVTACPFGQLSGVWQSGVFVALQDFDIPT